MSFFSKSKLAVDQVQVEEYLRITLSGIVQGVGYRPLIYRLATKLQLTGWVTNGPHGLVVEASGPKNTLNEFIAQLKHNKPSNADVHHLNVEWLSHTEDHKAQATPSTQKKPFNILKNKNHRQPNTQISPDLALCKSCAQEMFNPNNRRYHYPFISCAECGPRWSITQQAPYERANTSMGKFRLCSECLLEYHNPDSRRFHHQINSCPRCGPELVFWDSQGRAISSKHMALKQAVDALHKGKILAIKGIGGFELIVSANNEQAVKTLRERKGQLSKPLQVLCANLYAVESICRVDDDEQELLRSAIGPVVLLQQRARKNALTLAESIAPNSPYLGAMLPSTPLHHLLATEFGKILAITPGTLSEEPNCIDEQSALMRLGHIADYYLVDNLTIVRPMHHSIMQMAGGKPMVLQRARGIVPKPIRSTQSLPNVLAVGAHHKNTIALANHTNIKISSAIGDLTSLASFNEHQAQVENLPQLYHIRKIQSVAHDLHPDYLSSQNADSLDLPNYPIQHHHAHIAACMAEHQLSESVLGMVLDDIGLGDNDRLWGGEFMMADAKGFERIAQFVDFPLIGGNNPDREPSHSAIGMLFQACEGNIDQVLSLLPEHTNRAEINQLFHNLQNDTNCINTSSVARLMDGLAYLFELRGSISYHEEACLALQYAAESSNFSADKEPATYKELISMPISEHDGRLHIDWRALLLELIKRKHRGENAADLARAFLFSLVDALVNIALWVRQLSHQSAAPKIVLSGECFQNPLLLQLTIKALQNNHFDVYWPEQIPPNDEGIALGQAVIAATRWRFEHATAKIRKNGNPASEAVVS